MIFSTHRAKLTDHLGVSLLCSLCGILVGDNPADDDVPVRDRFVAYLLQCNCLLVYADEINT